MLEDREVEFGVVGGGYVEFWGEGWCLEGGDVVTGDWCVRVGGGAYCSNIVVYRMLEGTNQSEGMCSHGQARSLGSRCQEDSRAYWDRNPL